MGKFNSSRLTPWWGHRGWLAIAALFGSQRPRKSLVQGLQILGVPAEVRAAYVGHKLDDEHQATYSRALTVKELLDAVKKLDWKNL